MLTDIEIAQQNRQKPIALIAKRLGLHAQDLIAYGQYMAKIAPSAQAKLANRPDGKLILVTAISPTPAGEGKTTTTIGLADALNRIGKNALVCLREPSMGPVFGMKGGATGGGFAQIVPMENINLHFTGDFHAITSANNLLAALIDNHIHHGNQLAIDVASVSWRRCLDVNDRALRRVSLHQPRHDSETGFDITVASEIMAIFCLAENLNDLKTRLGRIQIGKNRAGKAIFAQDLQAEGAMTAILKDAFQPNLVQTLEHTPAIVHGGPFANIAHGCNSVAATKTALKLADYIVTEAGFGADLGAEKFLDIKCRQAHLQPDLVVIVATIRALKYHGGASLQQLNAENITYLSIGINNLKRHINNIHKVFGLRVVIAINHFTHDTAQEINYLKQTITAWGHQAILCKHWAKGGRGAKALATAVADALDKETPPFRYLYADTAPLLAKIEAIAIKTYGASGVALSETAQTQLTTFAHDYPRFPVCIAKTQYSFSSDPGLRNAPEGHVLYVRELRLSRGAGFIVVICGDMMTMPGLPQSPASAHIGVDATGKITGLN